MTVPKAKSGHMAARIMPRTRSGLGGAVVCEARIREADRDEARRRRAAARCSLAAIALVRRAFQDRDADSLALGIEVHVALQPEGVALLPALGARGADAFAVSRRRRARVARRR